MDYRKSQYIYIYIHVYGNTYDMAADAVTIYQSCDECIS